jgi:hypothetical protein
LASLDDEKPLVKEPDADAAKASDAVRRLEPG